MALEDLTITNLELLGSDLNPPSLPLSPRFFSRETPSLRHLKICMLPFDWTHPLLCSTLRTLIIDVQYDQGQGYSQFPQPFTALERMPHLESIYLNEAIPHLPGGLEQPPEVARTIVLPNLHSIEVISDSIDAANFLQNFAFSPSARIIVSGRTSLGAESLVRVFNDRLGVVQGPTHRTLRLEKMYSLQIKMTVWDEYMVSEVPGNTDLPSTIAQLCVNIHPQSRTLQTLANHSPFLRQLQRLEIDTGPHNGDWKTLFQRMPELQVLSITDRLETDFLGTDVLDEDYADTEPGGDASLLPHLHTLELDGVRLGCARWGHQSQVRDDLLDWLMLRCYLVLPIQRLRLRACLDGTAERVCYLREVVSDVDWDGREHPDSNELGTDTVATHFSP
ncbi:hypothetical protein BC628DRAFT_1398337 [Trametes gibbosa]|nr:hypothetical protein BC628DRAFT_1398337 [Trametes gibbosa]